MIRGFAALATLSLLLAAPALAQAPQPTSNLRGVVVALNGAHLTVKTRAGAVTAVTLPDNVMISAMAMRHFSDIKPGDYVGATAVPGPDGKLHAKEVHIFPEALRGVAEGHHPYDYAPHSTMTNATVAKAAAAPRGRLLVLKYPGGTTTVEVDAGTPIVTPIPGDRSLLKPGAAVVVTVVRQPDGSLLARRISAEKNGVKPVT